MKIRPHAPTSDGRHPRQAFLQALLAFALASSAGAVPAATQAPPPQTVSVSTSSSAAPTSFDGVVEAVRQSTLAAQVAGMVIAVEVKPGDRVRSGQLLLRLDARGADQAAQVSEAQIQSGRAQLELASRELARQQQLFQKAYISRAALEQAEAAFKATRAQVDAQLAQAAMAGTNKAYFALRAPFDGVVASIPVVQGDMAMPGRPLVVVYDPRALRVNAHVPQSALPHKLEVEQIQLELSVPGASLQQATSVQLLPSVDPGSQSVELRLPLPAGTIAVPGSFARVWLAAAGGPGASPSLLLPQASIVRRAELQAVYVLDPSGRALLRQVRLGRTRGAMVEVLAGVSSGERVLAHPEQQSVVP